MDFKSIFKAFLVTGAGLALLALVFLPHLLAPMAQWGIYTLLSSRPGLGELHLPIGHIGMGSAVMGPISLGNHVVADAVTLHYPLASLLQGRPGHLHISGLDIRSTLTDDGLTFPDVPSFFTDREKSPPALPGGTPPMEGLLRHLPSRVDLTHSRFALSFDGGELDIPFEVSAVVFPEKKRISLDFHLFPLGQRLHGFARVKPSGRLEHFELAARGIDYARFNGLLHRWFPTVTLRDKGDVTLTGKGDGTWTLALSHLAFDGPYPIALGNIVVTLVTENDPGDLPISPPLHARFTFQLDRGAMPPLLLSGRLDLNRENHWQLNVANQSKETAEQFFRWGDIEVRLGRGSRLQLDLGGKGEKGQLQVQLAANGIDIQNTPLPVKVSHVLVKGGGPFDFSPGGAGLRLDLTTTVGRVEGENSDFQILFPGSTLPLHLQVDRGGKVAVTGGIKTGNARISRRGSDGTLMVSGIDFDIPFSWPMGTPGPSGFFSGESISYKRQLLGALGGKVTQTIQGIDLSGTVVMGGKTSTTGKNVPLPGAEKPHVRFAMTFPFLAPAPSAMALTWEMPPFSMTHEMVQETGLLPPEVLLPSFNATLAARGSMVLEKGAWQNQLRLELSHGEVSMADPALEINGINATLVFDELPRVRSAPGMIITMDSLRFNKMVATDALIRYTIESATDLLLEKVAFNWCGGEVTTGATRFSSGIDAYHMRLFCHRLRFADLLQQVGSFMAEGEGSLNGQIPVSWAKGNLSFDNGFLYSTPGLGGTIRVSDTELLTAGIPVDTPQFGQMDLAREALKNYTYKWARVGFNSKGEDLMVKLEFDGSPESILPFEYRKDIGGFVRVDASSPGSRFQGIKLDVNLNLPFNQVMKLGSRLNNLFRLD